MRILLINPPINTQLSPGSFPLGLGYISSKLLQMGHEVEVIDTRAESLSFNQLYNILSSKLKKFDIVGITGMITVYESIKTTVDIVKSIRHDIPVILGGSAASSIYQIMMQKTKVDYLCIGEGEDTIEELVNRIESSRSVSEVQGLCYREGEEVKINSPRPLISDLDLIPFPAREIFPVEYYINKPLIVGRKTRSINFPQE